MRYAELIVKHLHEKEGKSNIDEVGFYIRRIKGEDISEARHYQDFKIAKDYLIKEGIISVFGEHNYYYQSNMNLTPITEAGLEGYISKVAEQRNVNLQGSTIHNSGTFIQNFDSKVNMRDAQFNNSPQLDYSVDNYPELASILKEYMQKNLQVTSQSADNLLMLNTLLLKLIKDLEAKRRPDTSLFERIIQIASNLASIGPWLLQFLKPFL